MTSTVHPLPVLTPDIPTSAHSFEEYRRAFELSEKDLAGRVLDCPGGAAGLVAGLIATGGQAVAVDPLYALAPEDLRRTVLRDIAAAGADVRGASGDRTAHVFLDDVEAHPERYLPAALPYLPFADGTFDLALTSHLLFAHADALSVDDHVAALVELARVAREVRVYPLVDADGTPRPDLVRAVIARLKKGRLACRIEPVTSPFEPTATTRLVVEHVRRPEEG